MKKHALVIGSGVASTAYISLLDFNKIKTSVIGSPYEFKEIENLKKNKKIKLFNLKFSNNIKFFFDNETQFINKKTINLIIIGTNTKGIDWAINILNKLQIDCPILLITKGIVKKNKVR